MVKSKVVLVAFLVSCIGLGGKASKVWGGIVLGSSGFINFTNLLVGKGLLYLYLCLFFLFYISKICVN